MFISDALAELVTKGIRLYGHFRLDVPNGGQFVFDLFGGVDCLKPDPMFVGNLDHIAEVIGDTLCVLVGWVCVSSFVFSRVPGLEELIDPHVGVVLQRFDLSWHIVPQDLVGNQGPCWSFVPHS